MNNLYFLNKIFPIPTHANPLQRECLNRKYTSLSYFMHAFISLKVLSAVPRMTSVRSSDVNRAEVAVRKEVEWSFHFRIKFSPIVYNRCSLSQITTKVQQHRSLIEVLYVQEVVTHFIQ